MPYETVGIELITLMAAVKTLILVMGGLITYFAFKAYRRTRDPSLGLLTGGFALVTIGALFGGLVHELIHASLALGVLIEGIFVLAGLVLIAYSLWIE